MEKAVHETENGDKSLYERLLAYARSDYAAFHMPGHKRQVRAASLPAGLPWELDITEIEGFDNLHHAEGMLKEAMEKAASLYGSRRAFFSVGGSTAGILSAVFAAASQGDTILMGRNCHKSVYHAVLLRGLRPLYIYPEEDTQTGIALGYDPNRIEEIIDEHPEIRAVILTSPTYEGVISDIGAISKLLHRRGITLIVDEAHGAHLSGRNRPWFFPESAVDQGADIVIQSLHKTLPSLTQTGLVHLCGDMVAEEELARYMGIFQTSSPSYILMASIDSCIRFLAGAEGTQAMQNFYKRVEQLRSRLRGYRQIRLAELPGAEPSKLVVMARGMTGRSLYELFLDKYHIQAEMCTGGYLLFMTGMFDTDEMYGRLCLAFDEIEEFLNRELPDREFRDPEFTDSESLKQDYWNRDYWNQAPAHQNQPRQILIPAQADRMEMEEIPLAESVHRISGEYAYQYPPGIPLLVPGEEIDGAVLQKLMEEKERGLEIQGLKSRDGSRIRVIRK